MHLFTIILFSIPASASLQSEITRLFIRADSNEAYLNSVCSPNITNPSTIPPCISITSIQTQCAPNGTNPAAYAASAQCLCNPPSSFFQDWLGCRKCLQVHGGLNELEYNQYSLVLNAASSSLCSTTPTASFADIFSGAKPTGTASGVTVKSDQFPSSSAVSLYYTASGKQGPGAFTAVSGSGSASRSSSGALGTGISAGLPTGTASGSSQSSTAKSEAKVTSAPLRPLALAIAGGMAIAVL